VKRITNISELTPAKRNAREHGERNLSMIEASLKEYGAARSIVVDEDGEIIAGHGTVSAAKKAGITKVRTVETDGQEIVAVVRSGLSRQQKDELAISDNRSAELADWDPDVLGGLKDQVNLGKFFDENELGAIVGFGELSYEQIKELKPPPNMMWILVGVDVSRYGAIREHVQALEQRSDITVKTTRDGDAKN
jgi:ParB-like chromosome segregation protein Spo0J